MEHSGEKENQKNNDKRLTKCENNWRMPVRDFGAEQITIYLSQFYIVEIGTAKNMALKALWWALRYKMSSQSSQH